MKSDRFDFTFQTSVVSLWSPTCHLSLSPSLGPVETSFIPHSSTESDQIPAVLYLLLLVVRYILSPLERRGPENNMHSDWLFVTSVCDPVWGKKYASHGERVMSSPSHCVCVFMPAAP